VKLIYHHRTRAEDGQAVHIRALIDAFRAEGHTVREVALVARAEDAAAAQSTRESASASTGKLGWGLIGRAPRLLREVAEYGYTLPARRRLEREARADRPDFLYERYAFGNAGGVQAAERLGLPLVLEVNSPMVLELSRTRGLSFPRFAARRETSIFRRATRVCTVTRVLRDMLADMGVERERIFVTPNGVHVEQYASPDRDAARAELGLTGGEGPVLGFVGYYRDWHRLDLVVEGLATEELRGVQLVLVGEGPAEPDLRERAERAGVADRVLFAGARPHTRIPAVLPAFDVALVPAINAYASPLKLHEYMAAGLAIVAPDQPNLREVLEHGESALLVPPGDGDALNAALARLVGDGSLRRRLGRGARAAIGAQDLTWRGNARRVIAAVEASR